MAILADTAAEFLTDVKRILRPLGEKYEEHGRRYAKDAGTVALDLAMGDITMDEAKTALSRLVDATKSRVIQAGYDVAEQRGDLLKSAMGSLLGAGMKLLGVQLP